jgi:hypothetical protein
MSQAKHKTSPWTALILTATILSAFLALVMIGLAIWLFSRNDSLSADMDKINNPLVLSGTGMQPCLGNELDECYSAPTLDIWPAGEGDSNSNLVEAGSQHEIGGRITSFIGNTMIIQTTSGRIVRVTFPFDVQDYFKTNRSQNYDGIELEKGDTVRVVYYASPYDYADVIAPDQIHSIVLALTNDSTKSDARPIKY